MRIDLSSYQTANTGLTIIGTLYEPDLSYEFNQLQVWKHEASNTVFWAKDSGCSCPSPFENYYFDTDTNDTNCEVLTLENWNSFEQAVDNFPCKKHEKMILKDAARKANTSKLIELWREE